MAHPRSCRTFVLAGPLAAASAGILCVAAAPLAAELGAAPPAGASSVGVTIDQGDYATAVPSVTLTLLWPSDATSAVVANDATFDAAGGAQTVAPGTDTLTWTLEGPPGATPQTVYVEFLGSASGTLTASASIVLDDSVPTLDDAELLPAPANAQSYQLRILATDAVSGIAAVETSTSPSGGVTTEVSPLTQRGYPVLNATVSPEGAAIPRFARVETAAGTWSPWSLVTPELTVAPAAHGGLLTVAPRGARIQLRGFDYQPLRAVKVGGKLRYLNDTFTPPFYRPAVVTGALGEMARLGYNAVRVFVNVNQVGNPMGAGIDDPYVSRMATFITTAQEDGIRVLLCTGELPTGGGYLPKPNRVLAGTNAYQLAPADIVAKERYLADLITALRTDGAPLSDVLWELAGEQVWNNHEAPLSLTRGLVRTAAGTYDMASASSRANMETNNLLHWVNVLSSEIHSLIPGSLVGVGIYPPSINAKRPGWTVRPGALFSDTARDDFVDIHVYSNLGSQVAQMQSYQAAATRKALIMGEFGAARSVFSSPQAGAAGEVQWVRQSCHVGLNLSGWLLWTWNSGAQAEYWTALDGNGVIEETMAPKTRANPCR